MAWQNPPPLLQTAIHIHALQPPWGTHGNQSHFLAENPDIRCRHLFFATWVYYNPRIIPSLVFLLITPALFRWRLYRDGWVVLAVFAGYLGLYLVPFDITFRDVPGPPRVVRYVVGLPSGEALALARNGDVVLHGCVRMGLEPHWVWVW